MSNEKKLNKWIKNFMQTNWIIFFSFFECFNWIESYLKKFNVNTRSSNFLSILIEFSLLSIFVMKFKFNTNEFVWNYSFDKVIQFSFYSFWIVLFENSLYNSSNSIHISWIFNQKFESWICVPLFTVSLKIFKPYRND